VSADSDAGIDKQNVLAAITGESTAPPQPAPASRPPSATRRAVPSSAVARKWFLHRSELSGIVSAFVGILWLSVGIARGSWGPAVIGILFGVGALAIWSIEVWGSD
jgi:hypothetical protein